MQQKTILITGASSGFGKAIAKAFAKDGHKLILAARRLEKLEQLKTELNCPVQVLQLDVTDKKAIVQAIKDLPEDFTKIDVLINNAGLALGAERFPATNIEDWETMIDTNIKGVVFMTDAIVKNMVKLGEGHIVNISSISGDIPYPGSNVYGASKAFVTMFSKNLKTDLVANNIRVTNIEPGAVETEFSNIRFKGDNQRAKQVYQGLEAPTAEDIAKCVKFAVDMPNNVNIGTIQVMPTRTAWAGLTNNLKS